MNGTAALRLEKAIGSANQAVVRAAYTAEALGDQSYSDDLWQIARELGRLTEDLLRSRRARRPLKGM